MKIRNLKTGLILGLIILLVSIVGATNKADVLSIKVNTGLKSENVKTTYTIEDWGKTSKLVTISLSNKGSETAMVKNIEVELKNIPLFDENSKLMYGGSCMARTFLQQRDIKDSITTTETLFLAKNAENSFLKVGILSWEIFQAKIAYSKRNGLIIKADGENKPIKPGETIQFERFVIENGTNWQDMMFGYGEEIAKYHKITPKKIIPFKGWATWDYYAKNFTDKEIEMNTKLLKDLDLDANIVQIDDGWSTAKGDFFITRKDIKGEMKGISKLIQDYGYSAGIWIDGFRAEKNSELVAAHPEYFLKNQDGELFHAGNTALYDYSNPAVREYMKNSIKTMREKWGYQYFKIDFLRYGVNEEILRYYKSDGLKTVKAFDPTMTSFERTRAGIKAMREGVADAYFLGCSSVFGTTFGLVDGLRTGGDIAPTFEFFTSRCLQNGGNFYLNKTVVQNDADYLLLRNKDDEEPERAWGKNKFGGNVTLNEAEMWADYVALFGGSKFSSDNLNTLRPERKELIKKTFALKTCDRFIPIDMWDKAKDKDDAFNIMLGVNGDGVYLALFNWNDTELGIKLSNIPTKNIKFVNSTVKPVVETEKNKLSVKLKPHTSVIVKLNNKADFDKVRKEIVYALK